MPKKKVFFACSMRGGQNVVSQDFLRQIPEALEGLDIELMSKHQTQAGIIGKEDELTPSQIYTRDFEWLFGADAVIAEISNPSLGVGGEISDAASFGKPILALYHMPEKQVSAYIRGKLDVYPKGRRAQYEGLEDLKETVREFMDEFFPDGW